MESDFLTKVILGIILYLVIKNEVRHYERSEIAIVIHSLIRFVLIYLLCFIFKNYIL